MYQKWSSAQEKRIIEPRINAEHYNISLHYSFFSTFLHIENTRNKKLTDIAGERVMFPMDTFNSSKEGIVYWELLFGWTGFISTWNLLGSSSSESESLDE